MAIGSGHLLCNYYHCAGEKSGQWSAAQSHYSPQGAQASVHHARAIPVIPPLTHTGHPVKAYTWGWHIKMLRSLALSASKHMINHLGCTNQNKSQTKAIEAVIYINFRRAEDWIVPE